MILRYKGQDFLFMFLFLSESLISSLFEALSRRCVLKFVTLSSNNVLEELVLSSLRASPLRRSLFSLLMEGRLKNGCTEMFQWA